MKRIIDYDVFERFYGVKLDNKSDEISALANLAKFILSEEYLPKTAPLLSKIPIFHPHMIPPRMRSYISGLIAKSKKSVSTFPRFPYDFSVDHLRKIVKEKYCSASKIEPFWPNNKRFAIIITHDVDTDYIFKNADILKSFISIEEKYGFRSAWYIVTNKYPLNHSTLKMLIKRGHEIGFHGDTHDYRLPFLKKEKIKERLDKCKPFLDKYNVKGGRSPLFLRNPTFFSVLEEYISYDTSCHDSTLGALSGMNEGCCSCFPFFISNLLEIPTTLPESYFLKKLGVQKEEIPKIQEDRLEAIRELGGVAHYLVHPEPQISANKEHLADYERFLEKCSKYKDAWVTLPSELNAWWRKRDEKIKRLIG